MKEFKPDLPITQEEYYLRYKDDPNVMALIDLLEKTWEAKALLEKDCGKMAVVLRTLAEDGNWKKEWNPFTKKYTNSFQFGGPRVGKELVEWIATQVGANDSVA